MFALFDPSLSLALAAPESPGSEAPQPASKFLTVESAAPPASQDPGGPSTFTQASPSPITQVASGIAQAGAILGLVSLICPHVRALRAVGILGIRLLSAAPVAATLLAAETYLLGHQLPEVGSAAGRLLTWDYANTSTHPAEDALMLAGFGLAVLGTGIGLSSFGLGARTYFQSRRSFLRQNYTGRQASRGAFIHGDAVRRAVQDPLIWTQFGRGHPGLLAWQRRFLIGSGTWANRLLIGGSAVVGVGRFGFGTQDLFEAYQTSGHWSWGGSYELVSNLALDLGPGVTTLLYRRARGDRGMDLGPALSQELNESIYQNPRLREVVQERVTESVPTLRPQQEWDFLQNSQTHLEDLQHLLTQSESLTPIHSTKFLEPEPRILYPATETPRGPPPLPMGIFAQSNRAKTPAQHLSEVPAYDLSTLSQAYASGELSPVAVLEAALRHPALENGAIFPRDLRQGSLRRYLEGRARESEQRLKAGEARPLEGILVAVKDLFPGPDGRMNLGSKTAQVQGVEASPIVQGLEKLGAIPFPVGMVAAANGGSGMNAGHGYVPHPTRPNHDPAGSSSATAHVLGLEDFPVVIGIGTDTGGSVTAPAGAVGLAGFVPPRNLLSTKNMVPFDTLLDRVGILAVHPQDSLSLVRHLAEFSQGDAGQISLHPDYHFQAAGDRPKIVYLNDMLFNVSPQSLRNFLRQMQRYQAQGFEVHCLGPEWNFLSETPFRLYPIDAYGAAAFAFTNPRMSHRGEPPRRSLDVNLWARLPKGVLSLRYGLFDSARALTARYQSLVRSKLGPGVVLASPSAEAIPKADIISGEAGARLDVHDQITMAKNRIPEWAQINLPNLDHRQVGITLSGYLPDILHFFE